MLRASPAAWQPVWVTEHRDCSPSSSSPLCMDTAPAELAWFTPQVMGWRRSRAEGTIPLSWCFPRMSLPGASTLVDNTCGCAHSTCRDGSSLSGKCCCDKAVPYHSLLLNICSSSGSVLNSNPTILNLGMAIERRHRGSVCAQVQPKNSKSGGPDITWDFIYFFSQALRGEKNP